MNNSRTLKMTHAILLLAISLFLTGVPGKVWGEEPVSAEYVKMLAQPCVEENVNTPSENIVEIYL